MERTRKNPIQIYRYIQMFSKNSHGYRAHAHTVRVKDLLFHLYHLYLYVFGQWTVMDSSFLKSLTGTARTCGTRDKFPDFTVHYCPLSRYNQISVTPVTPVTPDFLKVSRVLRTRIMRPCVSRTHLHGTREKFTHYSVTGVTVHLYGWGWVEDVSQIIHAYRVRAVRIIVFNFILHPPPPMCRTEVLHNDVRNWCVQIITDKLQIIYHKQQIISRNYG